jgi:hypothetical protein
MALAALIAAAYGQIGFTVGLPPSYEKKGSPQADQEKAAQSGPAVCLWVVSDVFSSRSFHLAASGTIPHFGQDQFS